MNYEINHGSYCSAIQEALSYAVKSGYSTDKENISNEIGLNTNRPKNGNTTRISLKLWKAGKEQKKMLQIQVYHRDSDIKPYELNCYVN